MSESLKAKFAALSLEEQARRLNALYRLMDEAQRLEDMEVRYFCQFFGGDDERLYTQGGGYSVDKKEG